MRRLFLTSAMLAVTVPALAADPWYLDDRTTPEALVRSLYNAIARREYARAWSYFDEKPSADLNTYAEGYADTDSISVLTGVASEQGAVGSVFYSLPVAIEARTADGDVQFYGGCYEFRFTDPQIQGEEYSPLKIVGAKLAPSSEGLPGALPDRCGDGQPTSPAALAQQRAWELFTNGFGKLCTVDDAAKNAPENFASWLLRFNYSYSPESQPQETAGLYRFLCNRGAYNESHLYVLADSSGVVRPVTFAVPDLDIRYVDDDFQKAVESIHIKGFRSSVEVVNSEYDPATMTLTSSAQWRGVGDASAIATWIFRDGEFSLTRYDVDAAYDGEISHETILDYQSGP